MLAAGYLQGGVSGRVGLPIVEDVPAYCPVAQPFQPISQQPKQKQAKVGTTKVIGKPTTLPDQMPLPELFKLPDPCS